MGRLKQTARKERTVETTARAGDPMRATMTGHLEQRVAKTTLEA